MDEVRSTIAVHNVRRDAAVGPGYEAHPFGWRYAEDDERGHLTQSIE